MKKLLSPHYFAVLHLGLRGVALVARFCLSLFMVKYLDLEAVGVFGLIVGIINFVPPAIGFGINYFFLRDIVGLSDFEAAWRVRDRLVFTAILIMLSYIVVLGAMEAGFVPTPPDLALILVIICLETVAFDINIALVALKMSLVANALVFVRTASWVGPFIAAACLVPKLRTLTFLMELWCVGLLASYGILIWQLRSWKWEAIFRARFDWRRLRARITAAPLIYLSDISIVGLAFLNRFILGATTNLEQVGIFVFFWTLANAIQVLVQTSMVQIEGPYLIEAYHKHGNSVLFNDLKSLALRSGVLVLVLSVVLFGTVPWIVMLVRRDQLLGHSELFILILMATAIQIFADVLSYGLYARRQDKEWAWSNILGVIISGSTTFAGILLFGLDGAAYSMVLTALFAVGCRLYFITKFSAV
jgi:O-antigen/teichoic acid export membrane protein